jgi:hypothetical protein
MKVTKHRRKPTVGPWHTNSTSQNRMHDHGENNNNKNLEEENST